MSEVITGDAVVVELRVARLASRALAFAVDLAVMLAALALLLLAFATSGALGEFDTALAAAIGLVVTVSVFIVYPVTVETLTRGRSLGKAALGLRVVREDGGPIRFRHALVRGLVGYVVDFGVLSAFSGTIGLISSLVSARGRRVGDALAGTVVVRERVPRSVAAEIRMPPALAGWARTLSLSQLPDPLALQVRQFLQRAPDLDPRVRGTLGESLAAEVAGRTAPAAPPGTAAEPYLSAVLAERRRREADRLATQRTAAELRARPAEPVAAEPVPAEPGPDRWRVADAGAPPDVPDDGFALPR
ncbi:RDD family protein [Pseudonocardia humida]|uniref:RDD family protein n=1 Tax=Pseudonocardia humida TaxID=2800819 RepID=UPI00207C7BC8|nr:RDD family protein [Pseudonocardia humida]